MGVRVWDSITCFSRGNFFQETLKYFNETGEKVKKRKFVDFNAVTSTKKFINDIESQ